MTAIVTESAAITGGCTKWAALKWAQSNNVSFIGEGKRKTYLWTEADVARFAARPKAGRPRKDKS